MAVVKYFAWDDAKNAKLRAWRERYHVKLIDSRTGSSDFWRHLHDSLARRYPRNLYRESSEFVRHARCYAARPGGTTEARV
jgi:hypothetical protein